MRQSFDGPETQWQLLESRVEARVLTHECIGGGARGSSRSERVVVSAPGGQSVLFICPIAQVAVIEELEVRIWMKANRPDVQLAARVVLPRTLDPQNGSPATAVVRGEPYSRLGQWQELTVRNVPKLLGDQVRVMRSTPGVTVDPREAFIDAIVLVVPGGAHDVEVVTDELVVDGVLRTAADVVQLASFPGPIQSATVPASGSRLGTSEMRRGPDTASSVASSALLSPVQLQGGMLLVDDKPFLPRVIQWQGEPLQFLAERGFNVLQLRAPPTAEQIAEAQRQSLWFVCAAPHPDVLTHDGLGGRNDRVLAWWLEDPAIETDPDYGRRWAELVRDRDAVTGRPVIISPKFDWPAASKIADILVAKHPRIGVISGQGFEHWLTDHAQLARPGTPMWTCFSTQFSDAVHRQCDALSGTKQSAPNVDAAQLESLVGTACSCGVPGYIFRSGSALSAPDVATQQRAATLEVINRRLALVEPWLAAGKVTDRIQSSSPGWTGVMYHVDRARLLIPVAEPIIASSEKGVQPATSPNVAERVFVIPGVPESCQVFALSPTALRTLPVQRVAGGTRVALRGEGDEFVLLTEDPQVIRSLRERIARDGVRIVRSEHRRASLRAKWIAETARQLAQFGYRGEAAAQAAAIDAQLAQFEPLIAGGRLEEAGQLVKAAQINLERADAEQRRQVQAPTIFDSNPLSLCRERLGDYVAFGRMLGEVRGGENLLYAGDFEDLGQMTYFGWQHFRAAMPEVESRAELSTVEPRHGSYCLHLNAAATAAGKSPPTVGGAPLWVQSPPMPVTEGQWIEITGWVRVDEPVVSSEEGLQIVDTLGGPELSLIIRHTAGWQPFRMIRAVPESAELRVTFALAGLGSARLDAVMVRALQQPSSRPLPAPLTPTQSPKTAAVENSGPLLVEPQSR